MLLAPPPTDEQARLDALHALRLLDTPQEERFDAVTRLAASVLQVPIAFVSLIDLNRQWFKSRVGFDICETDRQISFCEHTIRGDETLVIPDALQDPRFSSNPLVTGEFSLRFYAGHPLHAAGGEKIGTFCVVDRQPREFGAREVEILQNLAALIEREFRLGNVIDMQDELLDTQSALLKTQEQLRRELSDAAKYVDSLLPAWLESPLRIRWRFIPSESLGGDCLGYHELEGRIAIYLFDVCGHGMASALLSVTLLNVLRSNALAGVDFTEPGEVLKALNREFPMQKHGSRFFTIWYGIFDPATKLLKYASGGHPPAVLISGDGNVEFLSTNGIAVGCTSFALYHSKERTLSAGDTLYVFSDGAYEQVRPDRVMMSLEEFADLLAKTGHGPDSLDTLIAQLRRLAGKTRFADDISLLQVRLEP